MFNAEVSRNNGVMGIQIQNHCLHLVKKRGKREACVLHGLLDDEAS